MTYRRKYNEKRSPLCSRFSVFLLVPACISHKEKLLWCFWNLCDDGTVSFLGHLPVGQGPGLRSVLLPRPSWDAGE